MDTRGKQSRWWTNMLGLGIWVVLQLICLTIRVRTIKETGKEGEVQSIFVFWHNRILPCGYIWSMLGSSYPMCILTSASKDGALVESVLKYFKIKSLRGSTHRRAAVALLGMVQAVREGYGMAITPDGPSGPVYRANPGLVKLAAMTGVPVVPICIEFSGCWRIKKTWDGFCIPKPFSEIRVFWKAPIHIPREIDKDETEEYRLKIENAIKEGLPDFEPLNLK